MAGVDPALHGLQIAALLQALGNEDVSSRQGAPLDFRRSGLLVLRAHIGPHDAPALDARIGLDAHALAGLRRRRHVHAFPMTVELQPMIGAAEAVLLVAAEIERRAAVRAEFVDKADLPRGVAKRQKLLAEDLHALLRPVRLGNLARQQNRHPVTAHEIAHGGARSGTHQGFAHFLVHLLRLNPLSLYLETAAACPAQTAPRALPAGWKALARRNSAASRRALCDSQRPHSATHPLPSPPARA
jgi:hypothetical protein